MTQNELMKDIKVVLDISSRVDERVKTIQQNQVELNERFNEFVINFHDLSSRVKVLESRRSEDIEMDKTLKEIGMRTEKMDLNGTSRFREYEESSDKLDKEILLRMNDLTARVLSLEQHKENWLSYVKTYGNLLVQGIWVIIVSYVLYKLGLNQSNLP